MTITLSHKWCSLTEVPLGGAAPGSEPQRSPSSATGSPFQPPYCIRGWWRRLTGCIKSGMTINLSPLCTGMLKVSWTRWQSLSISYVRKTFAASRRHIFSPANPSQWDAISASGQTEQTKAKEEYWPLSETSTPVWRFWESSAENPSRCCRHSAG